MNISVLCVQQLRPCGQTIASVGGLGGSGGYGMTDEAKRQNYRCLADQVRRCFEAAAARCVGHEAAVAEEATCHQAVEPVELVEAERPGMFAFDADEPARLRRAFASWDFSNGT